MGVQITRASSWGLGQQRGDPRDVVQVQAKVRSQENRRAGHGFRKDPRAESGKAKAESRARRPRESKTCQSTLSFLSRNACCLKLQVC